MGLEDLPFTTELIPSEPTTHAIRYGGGPIEMRMLRDRHPIGEIFDSSSTSPHPRYATMTDGGGLGLLLVAQPAEHWGIRHIPAGEAIRAEQSIP